MRTSVSLSSVSRGYYPIPSSCPAHHSGTGFLENINTQADICNITPSPQRRRPGRHREGSSISPTKLPSSVSLTSIKSESPDQSYRSTGSIFPSSSTTTIPVHLLYTLRRNSTRRTHRPSISITSLDSISTLHHSRRSSVADLCYSQKARTSGSLNHAQEYKTPVSGSFTRDLRLARNGTCRKQRTEENTNSLDLRRSYTVFQRKLFRLKRQERILLLDKQWVHVLPSSTKTLNVMFDNRKSVSYHVRLLACAKVKSSGKSSIVIIGFKKGYKGRLKRYNLKAGNRSIAAEIVQLLWQMRAQFSDDKRS